MSAAIPLQTRLLAPGRTEALLGDGGIGTLLQAAGLGLHACPETWNLERPRAVARVHAAYREAGALWATTNTFGANRVRLARVGLAGRVAEVNAAAVAAARLGVAEGWVLGSLGPTTAPDSAEWEAVYSEQAAALAEQEVDGFLVETIVSLAEGAAAVRTCVATGAGPVLASFTPGPTGDLLDGHSAEHAAEVLFKEGALVVGVNCGGGPESLFGPAARLIAAGLGPVLVAPNAGLPEIRNGRARYDLAPDAFARAAIQLQDLGTRLIAGCCGTTPDHIRAAAHVLGRNFS